MISDRDLQLFQDKLLSTRSFLPDPRPQGALFPSYCCALKRLLSNVASSGIGKRTTCVSKPGGQGRLARTRSKGRAKIAKIATKAKIAKRAKIAKKAKAGTHSKGVSCH